MPRLLGSEVHPIKLQAWEWLSQSLKGPRNEKINLLDRVLKLDQRGKPKDEKIGFGQVYDVLHICIYIIYISTLG